MGDHVSTRPDAGVDRLFEGNKFQRVETAARKVDDRQAAVRIVHLCRRARKMLFAVATRVGSAALGKRYAKASDILGRFAKAADVDDRIAAALFVDVEHRCKRRDGCRARASPRYDAHSAGEFRIACRRDGHRPWEICRVLEPHSDARFGVERHQHGGSFAASCIRLARIVVSQIDYTEKDDAAEPCLSTTCRLQVLVERAVLIGEPRVDADVDELADLFSRPTFS